MLVHNITRLACVICQTLSWYTCFFPQKARTFPFFRTKKDRRINHTCLKGLGALPRTPQGLSALDPFSAKQSFAETYFLYIQKPARQFPSTPTSTVPAPSAAIPLPVKAGTPFSNPPAVSPGTSPTLPESPPQSVQSPVRGTKTPRTQNADTNSCNPD